MVEVIQNLVENASKFMGEQSHPNIEIGTKLVDGKKTFFVRDNGIGIEVEFHERIFGLFNKLEASTEGTGIGLALVKWIIEIHGSRNRWQRKRDHLFIYPAHWLKQKPPFGS